MNALNVIKAYEMPALKMPCILKSDRHMPIPQFHKILYFHLVHVLFCFGIWNVEKVFSMTLH